AGLCFGRQSGFMTGALAALVSNLFFGQGPWTPWQMYGWGCMGYVAGALQEQGVFKHQILVYVCGFIAPICYGLLLDTYFFIGFVGETTLAAAAVAYSAGLLASLAHAIATVVFLIPLYMPWRKKLHRLKRKYGIE
ncbi:MAG: ECF transporter S component, partial [Coriobacteriia bacterium]|nr:ECF transporter S component [Coriobacteriia bacterium]